MVRQRLRRAQHHLGCRVETETLVHQFAQAQQRRVRHLAHEAFEGVAAHDVLALEQVEAALHAQQRQGNLGVWQSRSRVAELVNVREHATAPARRKLPKHCRDELDVEERR